MLKKFIGQDFPGKVMGIWDWRRKFWIKTKISQFHSTLFGCFLEQWIFFIPLATSTAHETLPKAINIKFNGKKIFGDTWKNFLFKNVLKRKIETFSISYILQKIYRKLNEFSIFMSIFFVFFKVHWLLIFRKFIVISQFKWLINHKSYESFFFAIFNDWTFLAAILLWKTRKILRIYLRSVWN